jgi:predicted TIM-barrel fold metal-dependent hydrolase
MLIPGVNMPKLAFFDCNCSIGRPPRPLLLDISSADGLKAEMDTAGIEKALVYHTVARDHDPRKGNEALQKEIKGEDRLYPVWVVLPHHTGEMPEPKELISQLKTNGVKAVRMFPSRDSHNFSLSEWNSGELLSILEAYRIPLILDIEAIWWEAVYNVIKNHPDLPVITANISYRHNRYTYPIWEKHNNLFVETSRYWGTGTVEEVVAKFGAERILFGTNMPAYTGTGAVSFLTYSDIPEEDKQLIAGGNLENILKGVLI